MGERAYLALGSNLGDRAAHLALARARLDALPSTALVAAGPVEETAPLGALAQPAYLNQIVGVETALEPDALLDACQALERATGRVRDARARWASRTLDVDIVLWTGRAIDSPRLCVPHPGLATRDFWQRGLAALGVDWARALAHVPAPSSATSAGATP